MTNFFKTDGAFFSRLFKSSFFLLLLYICFSSCTVTRQGNYFRNITRDTTINLVKQDISELKIKKSDIITISISSLNKEEDAIYNALVNTVSLRDGGVGSSAGFLVDRDGNIFIHKLGKIKAEGLTRKELKLLLEKELLPYLKEPIVTVTFGNHYITVIGEINNPGILPLTEEKISILDILAQRGLLTPLTQLDNVMIIRDTENAKIFKHVNLEDHSIFTSPYYYLQPNDVVVLSRNERIVRDQLRREKYQQYSTVILQTISMAIIIYQTFFRRL